MYRLPLPTATSSQRGSRLQKLLDQRRILHGGLFAEEFSFALDLGVQLGACHHFLAEGFEVRQAGKVGRLLKVLGELIQPHMKRLAEGSSVLLHPLGGAHLAKLVVPENERYQTVFQIFPHMFDQQKNTVGPADFQSTWQNMCVHASRGNNGRLKPGNLLQIVYMFHNIKL